MEKAVQLTEAFGREIRTVTVPESYLKWNILVRFFVPWCRTGLALIFNCDDTPKTFPEILSIIKKLYPTTAEELREKYTRRALDVLEDCGLWQREEGGKWINTLWKLVHEYSHWFQPGPQRGLRAVRFFELLLYGPKGREKEWSQVLTQAAARAQTAYQRGKVVLWAKSWQHLWDELERVSCGCLYDTNIKFYHPNWYRVSIYKPFQAKYVWTVRREVSYTWTLAAELIWELSEIRCFSDGKDSTSNF